MTTLSPAQIYTLARNAGLSAAAATTATAVALAESGGRTDAQGDLGLQDATWGPSIGLWQIRSLKAQYGTGQPRDASRLADPVFNAASMASISGGGSNFAPWTTYKNGAYKSHLSQVSDTSGSTGVIKGKFEEQPGLLENLTNSWGSDALKIGLYVLGAGAAAALVIVGALHTVSDK